jgi:hypothetical protein
MILSCTYVCKVSAPISKPPRWKAWSSVAVSGSVVLWEGAALFFRGKRTSLAIPGTLNNDHHFFFPLRGLVACSIPNKRLQTPTSETATWSPSMDLAITLMGTRRSPSVRLSQAPHGLPVGKEPGLAGGVACVSEPAVVGCV